MIVMHRQVVAALLLALAMIPASAVADVSISSKPTSNMSCDTGVCTATAQKAVLNTGDLQTMLSNGDVKVVSGSVAMDIGIQAPLSWTSTSRLTLDSYRSISFDKPLTVAGTGALTITTNDGGSDGDFRFFGKGHVEFQNTNDSSLTINGNNYALAGSLRQLQRFTKPNLHMHYIALAKSVNAAHSVYSAAPIPSFGEIGGVLEGLGNTISNLTINDPTHSDQLGLVGWVEASGGATTIRDFGLLNVAISGTGEEQVVGALVGENLFGSVLNSYATGQVSAVNGTVGGLLGTSGDGTIAGSSASVAVFGGGGIFAAGGLVGDVTGDCFPQCAGAIRQSYSNGAVSVGDNTRAGGLAGRNLSVAIENSYATGSVTAGANALIGGLIGDNEDQNNAPASVQDSYSTGHVTGGQGVVAGGLIGQDLAAGNRADTYWDFDTSGISEPSQGAGNIPNDPGITGLSDAQLKSALPAGFDPKVWGSNLKINAGYPHLLANPPR